METKDGPAMVIGPTAAFKIYAKWIRSCIEKLPLTSEEKKLGIYRIKQEIQKIHAASCISILRPLGFVRSCEIKGTTGIKIIGPQFSNKSTVLIVIPG